MTDVASADHGSVRLHDGVAVITGGASGIGYGLAQECVARGMNVVVCDVRQEPVDEAARRLGPTAIGVRCDVRDDDDLARVRSTALEAHGRIDLVCLNAGVGLTRPLLESSSEDWRLLVEVNLLGVANGVRTFLPTLVEQGSGHLNATSSLSGLVGDPGLAVYNATKFGVVGLMEALALELRSDHPGVSASVLCPGPVATDLASTSDAALNAAGADGGFPDEVRDYLAGGLDPAEVGRRALDGIEQGRFWLLTHPELTFEIMDPRHAALRAGDLYIPPDWTTQ